MSIIFENAKAWIIFQIFLNSAGHILQMELYLLHGITEASVAICPPHQTAVGKQAPSQTATDKCFHFITSS